MNTEAALADTQTTPRRTFPSSPMAWKPLLLFIFFCFILSAVSHFIFQNYKESIKQDKQAELGGVAELKIGQITSWMAERKGDAQAIRDDPLFLDEVERWLRQGGQASSDLRQRLVSLRQSYATYGYTTISLVDDKALVRLSTSANAEPIHGDEKELALNSMRTGQIFFSDIHREINRSGEVEVIEIDMVTPLLVNQNGRPHAIGAVFFHIDPQRFLFPLIRHWPTPSASAENLLVRRDGDEVVFLNQLRHRDNVALAMRLPLSPKLPAAMALAGREGLVEGVDYRGVPVVGVLSKVPGTSWFMVNKVDEKEIYAPINHLANWVTMVMLGLVGMGGGLTIFWREKEKQHYESELEHQALTKHLDYLGKYANDIILLLDSSGKVFDFNDRALEAFGYSAEELSALNLNDLRAIDLSLSPAERFRQIDQAGGALVFETTLVRRNGENFPVEASVRVVNIAGEKFYQGIIRDITERKRAESELARQETFIRQVIDSNPSLIFVKDAQGKFLLANEAMAKSYGQTTDGIVGKDNSELVQDPELAAAYDSANREVLDTREERIALETGVLADGRTHWFQTIRKPLGQQNGSPCVLTIATDITELKEVEREQQRLNRALRMLSACNAVLAHAEEEQQLLTDICELIVEAGGYRMAWVGYAEHDQERNVRVAARYGLDDGYLDSADVSWADTERGRGPIGVAIRTGTMQVNQNFRDNPLLLTWREAALARGYQSSIAIPFCCDKENCGSLNIYSAEAHAFNTEEEALLRELADNLAFGITTLRLRAERAQVVEKLRQSEAHFRFLMENAADMVLLMSVPSGCFEYVSPISTRLFGYTPDEFYHTPNLMHDIIHPGSRPYLEQAWKKLLAGVIPPYYEYCIIHKSGALRWMNQRNAPIWSGENNGTLIAIQGIVTDITERKLAEAQLNDERARLRTLVQSIPDLIWLKDPHGVYLGCNPQFERYFGAPEADILGKTDYDFVDAGLADLFRKRDHEAMVAGKPCVHEEWITYPDTGQRALLETIKVPVHDDAGKLIGVMGIARDITERKRAEEELKFKNTLLATQREATIDSILVVDENGDIISFNRRFVSMWAVPDEAVEKKSDRCIIQALLTKLRAPEQFLEKVQSLYQHPQETSQEEIALLDGRVIDYYTAPMNGSDETHYGRIWYFRDITERKQAEDRESRLRHLLDSTLDMIFIFRPDSLRFVYFNKGALDSIGYRSEELLLMTPQDIEPLLPEPEFRALVAPLISGEKNTLLFETTHRHKNGTDLPVEVHLQLAQDQDGERLFVSIVRDISERKRAEMELHRQRTLMWQVIDSDPNQIFVKDAQGNFLLANQSLAAVYGLTPNEVVGKNQADINPSQEEVAKYLQADCEVIKDGREISLVEPNTLPNGERRWFLTVKKPLTMPDGKLSVLGIAVDITEQKLSEIKLAESYRKLQRLSLHLENIRADERAKIALNLHDEMGATLVAIKMSIAWLASRLPDEAPQLSAEVAHITELVSGGIHTMHRIVTQLRPNLLSDVGLAAAIKDHVKKFRQHTNIECILALPEEEFELNADQSLTLFRIIQESLNNVAKHAQATKVSIHFSERSGSLLMVVKDNGIGFDLTVRKEQSLGLLGIRERALMIGGKARISSILGKGTRVSVSIPRLAPRLDFVEVDDA